MIEKGRVSMAVSLDTPWDAGSVRGRGTEIVRGCGERDDLW